MRLGIMQPYFFPYIGYFDVIRKTDQWIVFDVVKYQSKSWMNRNRILEPNKGEQYVTVPVDKSGGRMLSEIPVKDAAGAREKILRQLGVYRGIAPHYDAVSALVEETFSRFGEGLLRDLNVIGLDLTCAYLGIPFSYRICSELDLDYSGVTHAGQWALEISDQLGATSYLNPSGGTAIFRPEEWMARGIDLVFTTMPDFRYPVGGKLAFAPHLSILDCMMWVEPEAIRAYLDSLAIVPAVRQ